MALLRTVPWNSQPQCPVDIDGFNPVFVLLGSGSVDLVTKKALTQVNGSHLAIRSPNITGIGFKPGGGSPYASGFHVRAKQAFILTEGASLVWVGTITQTDATNSVIASRWSTFTESASYAGQWRLEISSTNEVRIAVRADGGVTTTINSGLTVIVGRYTTISVKMLSSSIVFTVNGIESEQSATPQTSAGGGGNNVNISIGTTSAGGYNGHQYTNCALLYGLIGNKPSNPWQIFQPIPRRIFDQGAAGGATTYTITAQPGSYTLTGQSATLLKSKLITAQTGTYTYAGNNATLTFVPNAAVYTLTAQVGTYSYSGTAATISRHKKLIASTGSYGINGQSATITRTTLTPVYTLTALPGSYSLSGTNATILKHRALTAAHGVYSYSGVQINITAGLPVVSTLVKYVNILTGEILILRPF